MNCLEVACCTHQAIGLPMHGNSSVVDETASTGRRGLFRRPNATQTAGHDRHPQRGFLPLQAAQHITS